MNGHQWIGVLTTILTMLATLVVWGTRLEGRVNLVQRLLEDELQEHRRQTAKLSAQLKMLESKIDRVLLNCVAARHMAVEPLAPAPPKVRDDEL